MRPRNVIAVPSRGDHCKSWFPAMNSKYGPLFPQLPTPAHRSLWNFYYIWRNVLFLRYFSSRSKTFELTLKCFCKINWKLQISFYQNKTLLSQSIIIGEKWKYYITYCILKFIPLRFTNMCICFNYLSMNFPVFPGYIFKTRTALYVLK